MSEQNSSAIGTPRAEHEVGAGTLLAPDVVLGHPGKATLLASRNFRSGETVTIGARCILRSGTVVYERASLGSEVQTAHNVVIREDARVGDGCVFGNGSVVREGAVLGRNVRLMECVVISEGATVGDDVFVGPNVTFTAGRHMTAAMEAAGLMTRADATAQEGRFWTGPSVVVESEVRIGANAVVLAGVRLGKGCVVAAGTVVSTDVPAGATVMGNPGRIVKRATPDAPSSASSGN
jgi:acetyltransferase-like isoleucine patch superfamily enzyme